MNNTNDNPLNLVPPLQNCELDHPSAVYQQSQQRAASDVALLNARLAAVRQAKILGSAGPGPNKTKGFR